VGRGPPAAGGGGGGGGGGPRPLANLQNTSVGCGFLPTGIWNPVMRSERNFVVALVCATGADRPWINSRDQDDPPYSGIPLHLKFTCREKGCDRILERLKQRRKHMKGPVAGQVAKMYESWAVSCDEVVLWNHVSGWDSLVTWLAVTV
jgi:hypothetical protein